MNKSWRTNLGAAFGALGTTLMGVGVTAQLNGVSNKTITILTTVGFLCVALGHFFGSLFAADSKVVSDLSDSVADVQRQLGTSTFTKPPGTPTNQSGGTILGGTLKVGFALLVASGLFLTGCSKTTLAPGGVYANMTSSPTINDFLFGVDRTLVDSKAALDAFVTWEYSNHTQITNVWPNISRVADTVRANAPLWFTNAYVQRMTFVAILTTNGPANVTSNQLIVSTSLIQNSAQSATALQSAAH